MGPELLSSFVGIKCFTTHATSCFHSHSFVRSQRPTRPNFSESGCCSPCCCSPCCCCSCCWGHFVWFAHSSPKAVFRSFYSNNNNKKRPSIAHYIIYTHHPCSSFVLQRLCWQGLLSYARTSSLPKYANDKRKHFFFLPHICSYTCFSLSST